MKKKVISITLSLVMGLLTSQGVAFAHGTEKNDKTAAAETRMKKLHAIMPMFSVASAELETALEKGDTATATTQADRILAAVPDLKRSKPHKNVNQRKIFVGLATKLEETVTSTADLVKKGDIAEAKAAFKKVEGICAACHATFRD